MSQPDLVEAADPETVFKALSDGTRVEILLALWDADGPATFSRLREAVGVDDSGQFNYHLDKLRGRFVDQTDDGYALTLAGKQIVGAIQAGAVTMEGSIEPIALAEPCRACGGDRTLSYEDETVRVECESCPIASTCGVPPGVFEGYDRERIPAVTAQVVPVSDTVASGDAPERFQGLPMLRYDCERCGAEVTLDLGEALLDHPAVVSFFYEHGIDVREEPIWSFNAASTDQSRFRQCDPVRAAMTYTVEGDALTVVVDGDFEVVATERGAASNG